MSITLKQVAARIGGTLHGAESLCIEDVASLPRSRPGTITYLESKKQLTHLKKSAPQALITTEELADKVNQFAPDCAVITVADPQSAFIELMLYFRPLPVQRSAEISPRAFVCDSASIGDNCIVMPNAYIGKNVKLGNHCEIYPGAVLQEGCVLGDNCIVHANAVLYRDVILHDRVMIHANSVIGADGFGYRFKHGRFEKLPHTGSVIIESDVEIGACTTIDRGMIEDTVIGQGTKLDNLVQVAHNCRIGKHNVLASQVGIAGSCSTGDYVQMGGQAGLADHIRISDRVKIGAKAGVVSDLPPDQNFHGIPAIPEKDALRNHFSIQRLPELREQLKQLSARVAELETHLTDSQTQIPARVVA